MDDLLQSQIRQSCKLAFPNGLKDLMADISREVLRAQPQNLYQFIADYLSVMLVARENLNVAARVTNDVCASECCPEFEDELREVGLSNEDIEITIEIVMQYFEKSAEVKESTLLSKLMNKTELKETQLPKVLAAVRQAFLKHQHNKSTNIESDTNSDMDETMAAAKHTLQLYRQAADVAEKYDMAAEKIQVAYRAYNVRRKCNPYAPKREMSSEKPAGKAITFERDDQRAEQQRTKTLAFDRCVSKASSVSLAGSYVSLPPYKPYSANDVSDVVERDEDAESKSATFDHTESGSDWNEQPGRSDEVTLEEMQELAPQVKQSHKTISKIKSISFMALPKIIKIERQASATEEVDFEDENEKVLDVHEVEIRKHSAEFEGDSFEAANTNDNHSNKSNSTFSEDYSSGSSKGSIF